MVLLVLMVRVMVLPLPGNCLVLTGSWRAATRYEQSLEMLNPFANVPDPAMQAEATAAAGSSLQAWLAPLTYSLNDKGSLLFGVRGDKHGHLCSAR